MTSDTHSRHRPKAYSYVRFSTPEQAHGDSLRRQTEAAEAWAAANGMELDRQLTFQDLGKSAYHGAHMRAGGGLSDFVDGVVMGDIPTGSVLLLENLDRFSRQAPLDAATSLNLLMQRGIKIVTLDGEPQVHERESYSGPDGMYRLFHLVMTFGRAHEESRVKGERVRAAWANKRARAAAEGKRLTRKGPRWLKANEADEGWAVIPEKAGAVRRVFDLAAGGMGKEQIAQRLNAEGHPTLGKAAHWRASTVAKLLSNLAVIGTLVPHVQRVDASTGLRIREAQDPVPGQFPSVIPEDLWQTVQSMRKTPSARGRHGTPSAKVKSILARLAVCPKCGGAMTRVTKGERSRPKLVCAAAKAGAGCSYVGVDQGAVESALLGQLAAAAAEAPLGAEDTQDEKELANLQGAEMAVQEAVENLLDVLERNPGDVDLDGRLRARRRELDMVRDEMRALRESIAQNAPAITSGRLEKLAEAFDQARRDVEASGRNREALETVDKARLNALLIASAGAVVVDYPEGRLRVHWRHGGESELVYAMPRA